MKVILTGSICFQNPSQEIGTQSLLSKEAIGQDRLTIHKQFETCHTVISEPMKHDKVLCLQLL